MAKQMIDYAKDADNDLVIENGDFVRKESTAQHQRQIILCNKGEYAANPTLGVGAFNYLDDQEPEELASAISENFAADGMQVKSVQVDAQLNINTNASYK